MSSGSLGRLAFVTWLLACVLLPDAAPAQTLRTRQLLLAPLAAPPGVTATYSVGGVVVAWQGASGAATYVVLRGPDATTPGAEVGRVEASVLTFTDAGFNAAAGYQVVAVAADGRTAASEIVTYAPPLKMAITDPTRLATRTRFLSSAVVAPVITLAHEKNAPTGFDWTAHEGDTVIVTGTGFDPSMTVGAQDAYTVSTTWVINTRAQIIPITPFNVTATSFSFVPANMAGPYAAQSRAHLLVVTKGTLADTSDAPLFIFQPRVVRKITSVAQTAIRSGGRVKITGVGLGNVIGGYFGNGTPGSVSNPMWTVANRSDTYLELWTTPQCNQEGILMLDGGAPPGGGSNILITPDSVIRVGCYPGTPSGYIVGTESMPNSTVYAPAGSSITIRGSNLRAVTRVVDQRGVAQPFTYTFVNSGNFEMLSVRLPSQVSPSAANFGFTLDNVLTDPVVAGTVTGTVMVMTPPTWYRISPAWAEPGQLVTINGHNLKYNATPTVTVGGASAQVTSASFLALTFRMPQNATTAPIIIGNEGGSVTASGPFQASTGVQHPGFFVVSGPSSVTQIQLPRPTAAYGDTITVRGQNLARLSGICFLSTPVPAMPNAQWIQLRRLPIGSGLGYETSNAEMKVLYDRNDWMVSAGNAVQLLAPSQPVGDNPPSQFACASNPGGVQWP